MKVFIYERVSSEEQAKHGYSMDAQHEALTEFCKAHNHIILGEYRDEGISGRKPYTKRPAMLQLLRDVEIIKPDMILFTKLDRWFRNIKEYYKVQDILDRYKVDWKAIHEEYDTSTASGRLYVNIKLSIAQDEADRTGERIKDVHASLVAQGRVLSGQPPFGYTIVDKHLIKNEDASIVRDAYEHYAMHNNINMTTRYINDKYGMTKHHTHFLRWFRNPIYKGQYRDNPNFCEPILTAEEWEDLQDLLKRNIKHASRNRTYIFAGMIICPCCGRKMGGCFGSNRKYYRCVGASYHYCTNGHIVNEKKLEKWMLDNIEEDYKVQVTMKPKQKTEDPKKYKDRLRRLNEMYLMGNIDQAEYKAKSADLQQKIAELSKIPSLKTQNFVSNWKDLYYELDEEHRRSFWHKLVKEIHIDLENSGFQIMY